MTDMIHESSGNVFADLSFDAGEEDPGGHHWTFSQAVAGVAPEAWGGRLL